MKAAEGGQGRAVVIDFTWLAVDEEFDVHLKDKTGVVADKMRRVKLNVVNS